MSIVWVLGAGFSRSLGGPLLPQLLSTHSWSRLQANYPNDEATLWGRAGSGYVKNLLDRAGWEVTGPGGNAIVDAEDLLETLDAAAAPDGEATCRRLWRLSGFAWPRPLAVEAAAAAKHLIAAEIAAFLGTFPITGERWEPYVEWARSLAPEDVVITFNYDRVVEEATRAGNRKLKIVTKEEPIWPSIPKLIKLHGSVDWRLETGGAITITDNPNFAVNCSDYELAIASPGPTKKKLADQWKDLWKLAAEAIVDAKAVVFAGYRFPPSDAQARRHILNAITGMAETRVALHTVLGPDTREPDTVRLEKLLHYASQRNHRRPEVATKLKSGRPTDKVFSLIVQPLKAEDFISVVQRCDIEDPYRFSSGG